jgi:hypothetical protein
VLTRERARNPNGEGAETLTGSVDDIPTVLRIGSFLLVGAHN